MDQEESNPDENGAQTKGDPVMIIVLILVIIALAGLAYLVYRRWKIKNCEELLEKHPKAQTNVQ